MPLTDAKKKKPQISKKFDLWVLYLRFLFYDKLWCIESPYGQIKQVLILKAGIQIYT